MSDADKVFREDPWEGIDNPEASRRLYEKDKRFWVSVDEEDRLVFFIRENGTYEIKNLPSLSSLEVSVDLTHPSETRLTCTLTDNDLRDKFAIIAKAIAYKNTHLAGNIFLDTCKNQIISWGEFLKPSRKGLSHAEWIGYWGELYVLLFMVYPSYNFHEAVKFWIGPLMKKQDFALNKIALEIKTSMTGDAAHIRISSLDQLHKVTEDLYLLHLHISLSSDESGYSLKDLYAKAENMFDDNAQTELGFIDKTKKLHNKATKEQLEQKFNFVSEDIYRVPNDTENFPALTSLNINQGISAVKYSINPAALLNFKIADAIEELIKTE